MYVCIYIYIYTHIHRERCMYIPMGTPALPHAGTKDLVLLMCFLF